MEDAKRMKMNHQVYERDVERYLDSGLLMPEIAFCAASVTSGMT